MVYCSLRFTNLPTVFDFIHRVLTNSVKFWEFGNLQQNKQGFIETPGALYRERYTAAEQLDLIDFCQKSPGRGSTYRWTHSVSPPDRPSRGVDPSFTCGDPRGFSFSPFGF